MAFNTKKAGCICGNPSNGLCERVCVQVNKVFDGCITRASDTVTNLVLTDFSPAGLTPPYTFVSAAATGDAVVSDLRISPLPTPAGKSRVQFNAVQPLTVTFTDANGVTGTAMSSLQFQRDAVLHVPTDGIVQPTISYSVNALSRIGVFLTNDTVECRICILQIIRVTAPVELLVPSYGYCEYPDCTAYGDNVCAAFFARPLFPDPVV